MKYLFERLRRATWSYKQPLTHLPLTAGAPVSDLFVWRNSHEWDTFFELIDLPALFPGDYKAQSIVTLVFFDMNGQIFLEKTIEIIPKSRNTLALSEIIGNDHGVVGTFSVFHAHTPQILQALGSYLTDRGYISYRYQHAPLRSYVHGNLDAIARLTDQSLQLLGGYGILKREYCLQFTFGMEGIYELGVTNPTPNKQSIICQTLSSSGKIFNVQTVELEPCGIYLFRFELNCEPQRIILSSRLIMARPLVYHINNKHMDVFHG